MNTPKTDALIASLTNNQAIAFAKQTDRLVWIETELLDPANIGRHQAERVEAALIGILERLDRTSNN
jgi:hypothetical protein